MMHENKSFRSAGIDILKIVSSIAVIGLHTFDRESEWPYQMVFLLCGYAIPVFFCVNGYLILKKPIDARKLLKKCFHYIVLAFIWNYGYELVAMLAKNKIDFPKFLVIKSLFLQSGSFPHFWYLGALAMTYMIIIVLYGITSRKHFPYFITAICIVMMITIDITSIVLSSKGQGVIQQSIPQSFRLWTWLFYFTLPIIIEWVRNHCPAIYNAIMFRRVQLVVLCLSIKLAYEYFVGYKLLSINLPEYFYDNIFTIAFVIVLFVSLKDIVISNAKVSKVITELANDILGIYILHLFIKRVLMSILPSKSILEQFVLVISIFSSSAVVVFILRRLPILKRLVS